MKIKEAKIRGALTGRESTINLTGKPKNVLNLLAVVPSPFGFSSLLGPILYGMEVLWNNVSYSFFFYPHFRE